MISEIREAKAYHVGRVLRNSRAKATSSIKSPHQTLRDCFNASFHKVSWFLNNELVGLGGVDAPLLSDEGIIWMILTDKAVHHPKALLKVMNTGIAALKQKYRILTAFVADDDLAAISFAKHFGFTKIEDSRNGFTLYKLER
jgi:hypothetical protein